MEELKEGWRRVKLGEIGDIVTGKTPSTKEKDNFGAEYLFLTPKDMKGEKNIYLTERNVSKIGVLKLLKQIIKPDSVCVSCIGSDMGKVCIVKKKCITNQQINSITNIKNSFDYRYIYYKLSKMKEFFHNMAGGTTMPIINKTLFSEIIIEVPPLETQEKIASILSALDDKIEINNEMNKTLEEMAQTLFKRWFIDFDFPNESGEPYRSSGGKMVDSELGEIPEGWEVGAIKEIGEVITGKTPSTKNKENYGGKIPFITIPDMHGKIFITNTERYLSEIGNRVQSKKLLPVNSIIVSCIATVGLVSLNIRPSHTNQQINSIVPKSQNTLFYFFNTIKILEDKLKMIGSAGTTTLNVNKSAFENIRIVFPNLKLMETYNNFVKDMYLKIKENQQEIQSIIQIRDTLLPKLMSGEIEV